MPYHDETVPAIDFESYQPRSLEDIIAEEEAILDAIESERA